jgi:antitoxin VapB
MKASRLERRDIPPYIWDIQEDVMASLFIKDPATTALVTRLARQRGMTKTEAVRRAVEAELARGESHDPAAATQSAKEYLDAFYARYPIPRPSGRKADKAFFVDLSGNL